MTTSINGFQKELPAMNFAKNINMHPNSQKFFEGVFKSFVGKN